MACLRDGKHHHEPRTDHRSLEITDHFFASEAALAMSFCHWSMFFWASPGLSSYFDSSVANAFSAFSYFERSWRLYEIARTPFFFSFFFPWGRFSSFPGAPPRPFP